MTIESEMLISAVAPWFGSKRNLAPEIVAELGEHSAYWEPFCGSMAVLLNKPRSSNETVNDLHGDLVNLARTIKDPVAGPMLYRRLRRVWLHEDLFREAAARHRLRGHVPAGDPPDLQRSEDYFICCWFGRNGVAGSQSYNQGFCRRFTRNGGHAATRWESVVASIPAWRRRMRHVTILNSDGLELLEKIEDDPRAAIYCDPPYLVKGASYVHDFEPSQHEQLAQLLGRFKHTRCVVSYYEHPKLERLYPGWTMRRVYVAKAMSLQGKKGSVAKEAPEVLLLNGPSYEQQQQGSLL